MPGIKETLLNLASIYLFLSVPLLVLYKHEYKNILLGLAGTLGLAVIYPPIGWMRPHRHSDIARNRS